ncbi:hypothetical protein FA15DRAFT_550664, partial [Coprinopsis marcescibilis]
MNTVNAATSLSPFQLHLGRSPRLIPPVVAGKTPSSPSADLALQLVHAHELLVLEAQDNLLQAKVDQARFANANCRLSPLINEGNLVLLSTGNCWHDYKSKGNGRAVK